MPSVATSGIIAEHIRCVLCRKKREIWTNHLILAREMCKWWVSNSTLISTIMCLSNHKFLDGAFQFYVRANLVHWWNGRVYLVLSYLNVLIAQKQQFEVCYGLLNSFQCKKNIRRCLSWHQILLTFLQKIPFLLWNTVSIVKYWSLFRNTQNIQQNLSWRIFSGFTWFHLAEETPWWGWQLIRITSLQDYVGRLFN